MSLMLLVQADARRLPFADGSVQTCVTSPPYWGLRSYGIGSSGGELGCEPTPDAYVQNMIAVFREVRRVLRDDGTCWLNLGDSYASTTETGRNDAGRSLRDYRDDSRKAQALSQAPRIERKRSRPDGLKSKDLCGIPWRVAFALQADGWYLRSDIIWHKTAPMPESVTDRPTKAHEYIFLLSKAQSYYFDADAVREPSLGMERPRFDGSRGLLPKSDWRGDERDRAGNHPNGRNIRSVWTLGPQSYSGAHFAVMPEKLVERCVLAGSKSGDIVLDPFVGSGTVARVALRLGRKAIGCDLNAAYLKLADDRTRVTYGLPLEVA